ncbi:MAG: hypothetical protein K2H38_11685 [Muribaculaceae bacterium]|nr:hypothetical protein [Muribaculaceae bacterium]
MKPIGPILKEHIEEKKLAKTKIAEKVGITYNYLSTIFHKETLDASLLEKLCVATGLHPMTFFEYGEDGTIAYYSDIKAKTGIGSAAVNINHNSADHDRALADKERIIEEKERLLQEKERTIRILMRQAGLEDGA